MKHLVGFVIGLSLLTGCQAHRARQMRFGPPPPGYVKILGEAVPGWQPAHVRGGPPGGASPLNWTPLGPRPILNEAWSGGDDASGRVVSIAPHPSDANTLYIASASGGVWKTTDAGGSWSPLTDELATLNHGAVALDPSNPDTVYVGTGEYTTQTNGDGLFRSTDGGMTWERIATTGQVGQRCSRIIVDPTNPLIVHVTGSSGYARTLDGGATWTTPLGGSASDLALDPPNPQVVFVGRHNDAVYRSTNGGTTFTRLTEANGLPTTDVRRIILAVAASNPQILYTAIINASSGLRGLYKTTNGGDLWVRMNSTPNFPSPQGWYDACLAVDPTDPNVVYAGGVFPSYAPAGVIKSIDGGANWTDVTYGTLGGQLHPDQHAIAFGPSGTVWVGNDGGVWKSDDGAGLWTAANAALAVTQNYNIALHPTDPAQVIGGTQDNGTVGRVLDEDGWPQMVGGDGGFAAYDHANPALRYTTYVNLAVFRLASGGGFTDITGPWDAAGDPVNFIAPLVMDPNNSHTLLGGTNRVWRTTNAHASATWTAISGTNLGGRLNAIAVARGASNTIYAGSATGKVFVTTDAANWLDRSPPFITSEVADIFIDPSDPSMAYLSYHRTSGSRVFRTGNYGVNWTSVTGDLPGGVSARALAVDWRFDPPGLYVGTGVGVYSSTDGGVHWLKDGLDLPNVNIGDLAIDPTTNTITAGTYGRGAWRANLPATGVPGDLDNDGDADLSDWSVFTNCMSGPEATTPPAGCAAWQFENADMDEDADVDLGDAANFGEGF